VTSERQATSRHVVAALRDFPAGTRRIVEVDDRTIGVFNIRGRFVALRNRCPHQGAPLCLGLIKGLNVATRPFAIEYGREDEIIKCPWHGWEFEIATGRSVFNPHKVRVATYDVTVEPVEPEASDPSIETFPVTVEDGLVILHA
jgi:nitrite reductase/ring-hydroxylating ferredoxin subunit